MRITLEEKYPELAAEWSERNHPLLPDMVTYGSNRNVWWNGKCGHEWQATVKNRKNGHGCPYCSGNRVLAGINDLETVRPDIAAEWSERNKDVIPAEVTVNSNRRVWWKCSKGHEWFARISDRTDGHGCPYCASVFAEGVNDLETEYPELSAEWSDRNFLLRPSMVSRRSRENVWWKCSSCGHEWQMVIDTRVNGSGCPACSGIKVVSGINDLATTDPEIAEEWLYERNDRTPENISGKSMQVVWWKGRCGHEWRARIRDRSVKKEGCPVCEAGFMRSLGKLLVMYYAGKIGLKIILNDTKSIGLELEIFLPEILLAFEFAQPSSKDDCTVQTVKEYMCSRNSINLFILNEWKNGMDLAEKIKAAFNSSNVFIKTDTEKDLAIVRSRYFTWLKNR